MNTSVTCQHGCPWFDFSKGTSLGWRIHNLHNAAFFPRNEHLIPIVMERKLLITHLESLTVFIFFHVLSPHHWISTFLYLISMFAQPIANFHKYYPPCDCPSLWLHVGLLLPTRCPGTLKITVPQCQSLVLSPTLRVGRSDCGSESKLWALMS